MPDSADSNLIQDALFRAASEYALKNPPLINCPHCNKVIPADANFTQHLASCVNEANNQTRELPKRWVYFIFSDTLCPS